MSKFFIYASVVFLLGIMLVLAIGSFWDESAIMDEGPHVSAGYSYVKYFDMRINPEHPPLVKDFAGIAVSFLNPNFRTDHPSWKTNINDQWTTGPLFFYESGNDADTIIRVARLGVVWLLAVLGFFIFRFVRNTYGTKAGLTALFLFAFSPTFLAHGRYVTTDVAAALGFFIGIFFFLQYLRKRTLSSIISAGIALGIALLLKFSTFLLIPFLGVLTLFAGFIHWQPSNLSLSFRKNGWRLFCGLFAIYAIAGILIWIAYIPHVWNYPIERQYSDSVFQLSTFGSRFLVNIQLWMTTVPIFRPLAQYALGLLMVVQRAVGGNTTFFLGEIARVAWIEYFPVVFLIKEQLVLHILLLMTLFLSLKSIWPKTKIFFVTSGIKNRFSFLFLSIKQWLSSYPNFVAFAALFFIILYWFNSITSNLNIGVRHILPTLPFMYLLVARKLSQWFDESKTYSQLPQNPIQIIRQIFTTYIKMGGKIVFVMVLAIWYFITAIFTYPFYLSYFNELVGGPSQGHKYAVDSNLDWGQDLKRLSVFVKQNNISNIKVDYFGSGSPKYYLGEAYEPWNSSKSPAKGWFAVSATFLMGSVGKPAPGFEKDPRDDYSWLYKQEPVTVIGNSIFVYHVQ